MIGDELTLPPQDDTTIHLKFTGIEHHYYDEVMSKCAEDIRRRTEERATELALGKMPTGLSGPMRSWLLQLRQIWYVFFISSLNDPGIVKLID
jgi:hypothetical protein